MYDRVLFPTDGSEGAEVATDHALRLARAFDAPVHALYVVDTTVSHATDAFSGPAIEALADAGEKQLAAVEEQAAAEGIELTTELVEGQPASTIVDQAQPGDVIVLGTHGRSGLDRYLIGSTTEKVVRTADVPVVAVPVTTDGESAD